MKLIIWSINVNLCLQHTGQRKRKLESDGLEADAPPSKVPRPPSPQVFGPAGEMYFKVNQPAK